MANVGREDDGKKGRFTIYVDDQLAAEMTYTWAGESKFIIDHTDIEENFTGKGYGNLLLNEAVEFARKNNLKIIPLCPFAKAQFDKNPDISDVLF